MSGGLRKQLHVINRTSNFPPTTSQDTYITQQNILSLLLFVFFFFDRFKFRSVPHENIQIFVFLFYRQFKFLVPLWILFKKWYIVWRIPSCYGVMIGRFKSANARCIEKCSTHDSQSEAVLFILQDAIVYSVENKDSNKHTKMN